VLRDVDIDASAPEHVRGIRTIGHESPRIDSLSEWVYGRQLALRGKLDDPSCVSVGQGVRHDEKGVGTFLVIIAAKVPSSSSALRNPQG
jgi:hypothetical protein